MLTQRLRPGETLFVQGEPAEAFFQAVGHAANESLTCIPMTLISTDASLVALPSSRSSRAQCR